jgi:dihydroorotate dehydrogenase (NAD+) catalytic subunit
MPHPDLSVTVAGVRLKNPVMAGSGEATMTSEGIVSALRAGAAAVVAKSTNESEAARRQLRRSESILLDESWRPLPWGPAARGVSLFGRSGLVDVPFDRWLDLLVEADAVASSLDAYVVGSLIASNLEETVPMAKEMQAAGIRWLELNVGAPHASEAPPGAIVAAQEGDRVADLVRPVREAVSVPLTVKLSGEGDVLTAAEAAFAAGADAACIAGRFLAFLPDPESRRPLLGTFGAIGGSWALPLSLRWVAKASRRFGPERDLIGTNGARDGLDVVRFLLAGARAVQMTTAVLTDGPVALTRAIEELRRYLDEQGVDAAELVGEAARHALSYEDVTTEGQG